MKELKEFLEEHSAIKISAFAREVGCSRQMIDYIIRDTFSPSKKLKVEILRVMEKYGYKQEQE
jgi:DNA-binding LacI/PurR family transcriptional regulator